MSLNVSFSVFNYTESLPNLETLEDSGKVLTFRDLTKLDEPYKGRTYVQHLAFEIKGHKFFAFSNPQEIPANRYIAVTAFVTLSQVDATKDDLLAAFGSISQMLLDGDTEGAQRYAEKCRQVVALTNAVTKWLNLATAFLIYDNENPLYYETRTNKAKLELFSSCDTKQKKDISEWTRDYFDRLIQRLLKDNPECFLETEQAGQHGFFDTLTELVERDKQMSSFLNNVASKSQADRDRLLMYPVEALYKDMRTFIIEGENMVNHLEEQRNKIK